METNFDFLTRLKERQSSTSSEQRWLEERMKSIGASDAAAVIGQSPYMTNEQLWELKTRRRQPKDLSENPFIQYGKSAEPHLRALFSLNFPQYEVIYDQYGIVRNPDYLFISATLDGVLVDRETRSRGVLEIKTTEIMRSGQWDDWNGKIPQHYYIQCLHQLLASDGDFVILMAQIRWRKGDDLNITIRHYQINRADVAEDLKNLLKSEIEFWECVSQDKRPNMRLPQI